MNDYDGGARNVTFQYVVAYDSTGGLVTGGGWFTDPASGSKAHFGFSPKYQKDTTPPKGETEFNLGRLKFKNTSPEWLVIDGSKAQFKCSGTINGTSDHVLVTAIDGQSASDQDMIASRFGLSPPARSFTKTRLAQPTILIRLKRFKEGRLPFNRTSSQMV